MMKNENQTKTMSYLAQDLDYIWMRYGNYTRRSILSMIIATVLLIFIFIILTTPRYQTNLLFDNTSYGNLGGVVTTTFTGLPINANNPQQQVELIKSDNVIYPTVQKLHLDVETSPKHFPIIGGVIAAIHDYFVPPTTAPLIIDNLSVPNNLLNKNLTLTIKPKGQYLLEIPGYKDTFTGHINTHQQFTLSNGGIITIEITSMPNLINSRFSIKKLPTDKAADALLNRVDINQVTLSTNLIQLTLTGKNAEAITDTLNTLGEVAVAESKKRNQVLAKEAFSFLQKQLVLIKKQLNEAQNRFNQIRVQNNSIEMPTEISLLLESQKDLKSQLDAANQQMAVVLRSESKSSPNYQQLVALHDYLLKELAQIRIAIKKMPQRETAVTDPGLDVDVQTKIYQLLLYQIQQLEVIMSGGVSDIRIVQPASVPETSSSMHPVIIVIIGILLAVILICIFSFLRVWAREKYIQMHIKRTS